MKNWKFLLLGTAAALLLVGCGKRTTKLKIPVGLSEAKSAQPEEVLKLINEKYSGLETLTVSRMKIEFTGGSVEKGYLEEFPTAKGHLVASRPDSVYMNILNPVTSSTVVTMAATEGRFQIWVPRENKYLVGGTDLPADSEKPLYSVRPDHLLEALLIRPVNVGEEHRLFFVEEAQDATRKYYVVSEIDRSRGEQQICLERKLWVERSQLSLARQQVYDCGKKVSEITYGGVAGLDGLSVPTEISVERIQEHYRLTLNLEREAIRVNRTLKDSSFQIPRPPGAEVVEVAKELSEGRETPGNDSRLR
jgi:outer membrane lipoprotein-sorting protein